VNEPFPHYPGFFPPRPAPPSLREAAPPFTGGADAVTMLLRDKIPHSL
jgi:hypothetical protein